MIGQVLVGAQVSLCLVLLVGAAMFSKSLMSLYDQDAGFRRDGILLVRYPRPGVPKIPNRSVYFHDLAERLKELQAFETSAFPYGSRDPQ